MGEREEEGTGLEGDYLNVALLLLLYTLQGVPMGLSRTLDLILQEKSISFEKQGNFRVCTLSSNLLSHKFCRHIWDD